MTKKLQSTTNKLAPILALAVILGIWYACAGFEVVPAYMLPSPTDVWLAFVHNFSVMMSQAKVTLQEALYGLGIGVVGVTRADLHGSIVLYQWRLLYRSEADRKADRKVPACPGSVTSND